MKLKWDSKLHLSDVKKCILIYWLENMKHALLHTWPCLIVKKFHKISIFMSKNLVSLNYTLYCVTFKWRMNNFIPDHNVSCYWMCKWFYGCLKTIQFSAQCDISDFVQYYFIFFLSMCTAMCNAMLNWLTNVKILDQILKTRWVTTTEW